MKIVARSVFVCVSVSGPTDSYMNTAIFEWSHSTSQLFTCIQMSADNELVDFDAGWRRQVAQRLDLFTLW